MSIQTKIIKKIRRKLNHQWNDLKSTLGANKELFQKAKGARMLVYHGICKSNHTRFNSIFLTEKIFEEHLQFYAKYFHIISLDNYYNKNFNDLKFNICITFDDGFANNHKYVLPLLDKYKIPATFFVTAIRDAGYDILWNDLLCLAQKYGPATFQLFDEKFYKDNSEKYVSGNTKTLLKDFLMKDDFYKKAELIKILDPYIDKYKKKEEDYWLQMTKEEIKELSSSPLATIGSHGYYHNDLSQVSINDASNEMRLSQQWLENITGKPINAIAFPYGNYTRHVITEAKKLGFTQLLATDFLFHEDHTDNALRERLTINPYISINNQMIAIIDGKYK